MEDIEDIIIRSFRESIHQKEVFINENLPRLVKVVTVLTEVLKRGNKVLLFGNGGSAADAQHIAAEFVNRFMIERPPLPAIALTTDTSVLTSVANDYDFSEVFAKQIRALGHAGDVAWGITTSGTSSNVVKAFEVARRMDMICVGFTGKDGGVVAGMVDHSLNVSTASVPRVQEVHMTAAHVICEMVDYKLFKCPDG
ncbi:MAG: phosphoheptose isomerase [delta proteobacterium MLS_D]|jgi:D-sedoheptulose 7-phosphate isomerase|nr:MAG: phosphoheptose isomerase [delta proteobacterium MLS_D]